MKLPFLLLPLSVACLCAGGCVSQPSHTRAADSSRKTQSSAAPEREMNPVTGNYERQPPFGPRSVKETRQ